MKEHVIIFPENNRTFGVSEKFLDEEDLKFLKDLAEYLKNNNEKPVVEITVESKDRNGIINRINIYIKTSEHKLAIKNVYCGGIYGTDRIFEVLYSLEYLFEDLIGEKFDHYANYSISNSYKIL
jgi:small-conductance mechanosensitive channel